MHEDGISIWFFVGISLLVIGGLIFLAGVYQLIFPPIIDRVVLYELHAPVWWGALLLLVGIVYSVKFRPARS